MSTVAPAPVRATAPVVVFGATGFIGRHIVAELRGRGWPVRAFVRSAASRLFADDSSIEVVHGDLRDADAVTRALAGALAAVNAAGLKSDEPESEAVNVHGVHHLVAAARATGATRLVHLSTQAVKIARRGIYARTKLAADELLASSDLAVTILRPSVVYGPGRSGVFSTMQRAVERLPFVPVFGDGSWRSAPVHVDDVARAVAACLDAPVTIGRCYDLAGPDEISLDQLIDRIAALNGRRARKLHVPFKLALAIARVAARIVPRPPISVSNVLGSNQPIPLDRTPALRDFGFSPESLEVGLAWIRFDAEQTALREEARRFARYLLRAEPSAEIVARYAAAATILFPAGPEPDVVWVRSHPWTLPAIDAASAVFRPRAQLRQRLLVAAALLEASPDCADFYLAPPPARPALVGGLVLRGFLSLAKLLIGLLLMPFLAKGAAKRA